MFKWTDVCEEQIFLIELLVVREVTISYKMLHSNKVTNCNGN